MSRSTRRARGVLLAVLAIAVLVAGWIAAVKKDTSELSVYVTGADRMMHHAEIYDPSDQKPFTYPPFFALPFVPLVGLDVDLRRGVWFLTNVALLVASLAWLVRALRIAAPSSPGTSFWIVTALLAARHQLAVFENQSHDLVILACLCAALCRKEMVTGAATGLAAACKATPLLFLPTFLAQRRGRAALGLLIAVGGATLLPDLLFPRADGRLWFLAWIDTFSGAMTVGRPADAGNAWDAANFLNQNLAGAIHRLCVPVAEPREFALDVAVCDLGATARRALTLGAQAIVAALVAVAAWPVRARESDARALHWRRFGEVGAVACAMLLLSPMSSKSHFCVLLIPAAFCAAELLHDHAWRRRKVVSALVLLCFGGATLTTKGILGRETGNRLLAYGAVTIGTLALLCAVTILLRRPLPTSTRATSVSPS